MLFENKFNLWEELEQWGQTPSPPMELVQIVIQDLITSFYTHKILASFHHTLSKMVYC